MLQSLNTGFSLKKAIPALSDSIVALFNVFGKGMKVFRFCWRNFAF